MISYILWNKNTVFSLWYLILQQLIVASSTFWIVKLSEAVVNHEQPLLYLSLFISSLFLVYFPGVLSSYYLERSKCTAIYNYINQFTMAHKGMPTVLNEATLRMEKEPWLTSESANTIEEATHVIYDGVSTGLNTLFNIVALCLAIDTIFIYGYVLSFIILLTATKIFKNKLSLKSVGAQSARKSYSQILLSGWDNIIIGNKYNLDIWQSQYIKRWKAYIEASSGNVFFSASASTTATILSLIPICTLVFMLFIKTKSEILLVALIATLPRQVQIIQHFQILSTYAMSWYGVYAKLRSLIQSLNPFDINPENFQDRISLSELTISINNHNHNFANINSFLDKVATMKNGRICIQGKNGSGKTTLISMLKQKMGNAAYYYPFNTVLSFSSMIDDSYSTGQKFKVCFEEAIGSLDGVSVVLLDEWDANLDRQNTEALNGVIESLSEKYCVIEISHKAKEMNSESNIGLLV